MHQRDRQRIIEEIQISNPFEYLGPLKNHEFFFDRHEELKNSLIVCEQILRGTSGGVLIIGGRGSGKTSFVDELRRLLNQRNIANVKIPLNTSVVNPGDEVLLFRTIISELFKAAEEAQLLEKNIVRKILDYMDGLETNAELEIDIPGIKFIVNASKKGVQTKIPYIVLRDGLNDFIKFVNKNPKKGIRAGAIIIFDEGDVLTLNKDLLQILRNVFQDIPKIGLIVAGSTKLLTQVSEVFSPIPRFFRKIELGPYPRPEDVNTAIAVPLKHACKELYEKEINLNVIHNGFDPIIQMISGRMPMEINLLSYFAFDVGAKYARIERNGNVSLYMKVNKNLMDETIRQLRGAKEYDSFIDELKEKEKLFLDLLSRSLEKATVDELTLLITLHELGDKLQSFKITDICNFFNEYMGHRKKIQDVLDSIQQKAEKHKISVITLSLTGLSLLSVEDQWIRSYFKFGWRYHDVDIELGIKPDFGGIRVFGDPIATVIHSILFPRMTPSIANNYSFKAHTGKDDGLHLYVMKGGQIVGLNYQRVADGETYHLVFNIKEKAYLDDINKDLQTIGDALKSIKLIKDFNVISKR